MNKYFPFSLLLTIFLASCSPNISQQAASSATVAGTVTYRERISLSPTAELTVALLDVSRADVAAIVIATKSVTNPGQVPIAFELKYNPADIQEGMSYNIRATIKDDGKLLFTTDTAHPVLTRGRGNSADLLLISIKQRPVTSLPLIGTRWTLQTIDGQAIEIADNGRRASLLLQEENYSATGFSGCNQFAGTYKLEDNKLVLGPLAMTMMACIDGMDIESVYTKRLDSMTSYTIEGSTLTFYENEAATLTFTGEEPTPAE